MAAAAQQKACTRRNFYLFLPVGNLHFQFFHSYIPLLRLPPFSHRLLFYDKKIEFMEQILSYLYYNPNEILRKGIYKKKTILSQTIGLNGSFAFPSGKRFAPSVDFLFGFRFFKSFDNILHQTVPHDVPVVKANDGDPFDPA